MFSFNLKFRTKYYKVFRQALKYRSTKKKEEKSTPYTGFEHTHIGMRCRSTNGRAIQTDTEHALDRLNEISFHYFHPLTFPELTKVPLRLSSVQ